MSAVTARRRTRELVLQGLYERQIGRSADDAIAAGLTESPGHAKADAEYFHDLWNGVCREYDALLEVLEPSVDRNLKDVAPIERGLLAIGAWELTHRLDIPYRVVIDEAPALGGTWWKNRYPGVRLDTPTFGYSYSFAQKTDWPHQYAEGAEIHDYLAEVADQAGITDRIEFGTRFETARWDEEAAQWVVTLTGPNGTGILPLRISSRSRKIPSSVVTTIGFARRSWKRCVAPSITSMTLPRSKVT